VAVIVTRTLPGVLLAETRTWLAVAAACARENVAHRATVAASVLSNIILTVLRGCLALAVWRTRPGLGGYGVQGAVSFVVLGQALMTTFAVFGGMVDVPWRLDSGAIVVDVARPFGFQRWWLARELGRAAVFLVSRALPAGAVGVLVFGAELPASPVAGAAFVASLPLALLVAFGLRYLAAMSAFWTTDVRGVLAVSALALMFFSGAVLPLRIFPGTLGVLARTLPFGAIIQVPLDIYLRPAGAAGIGALLVFQAGWAVVLLAAGALVTRAALRRLVTQGG
jgi:ABC-2 type transport system permease protein